MKTRRTFLASAYGAAVLASKTGAAAPAVLENWWAEGGERIWVEGERLYMHADSPAANMATVWFRRPLLADFEFEITAHVESSSKEVNNINLFFCYQGPDGRGLEETSTERKSAGYTLYHNLPGYIVTFVNDAGQARMRIRRNPGFQLLTEARTYHCRSGVSYRLRLTKRGGDIRFCVDGEERVRAVDPQPFGGGHLGLRTFSTRLWWEDMQIK